jgi:hypothetical protein
MHLSAGRHGYPAAMVDGPADQPPAEPTWFAAFDRLIATCRRTRAALHAVVHDEARDPEVVRDVLAREALAHLDSALEGIVLLTRTGQFTPDELRALVRRAGIVEPPRQGSPDARAAAAEALQALQARVARGEQASVQAVDGAVMLAAGHARVVLSLIPSLPPEAVSWPRSPRSYADIPVPHSSGELLLRTEELARVVWRVAAGDERRDEPLRRTLAFYEAGARLSIRGFRAA